MINVKGKMLSEDTIAKACEAYGISFKLKHTFNAGDVVTYNGNLYPALRIIVKVNDNLVAYTPDMSSIVSEGQDKFDSNGYEYVGRLSRILKQV